MKIKEYLEDKVAHYVAGFITGFTLYLYTIFAIIVLFLFILYEFSEWYVTKDSLFPEIKEYTIGYFAGFITYILLELLHII